MPSVAQEARENQVDNGNHNHSNNGSSILSKKRRRDDLGGGTDNFHTLYNASHAPQYARITAFAGAPTAQRGSSHRKILPVFKRQRLDENSDDGDYNNKLSKPPSDQPSTVSSPSTTAPCHICHRRPRRKCDLDSLADCAGCGQRTCFVCLRECAGWQPAAATAMTAANHSSSAARRPAALGQPRTTQAAASRHASSSSFSMTDAFAGADDDDDSNTAPAGDDDNDNDNTDAHAEAPNETAGLDAPTSSADGMEADLRRRTWSAGGRGHRRMICSQCCVERGVNGDVVCLGCLPFVEG